MGGRQSRVSVYLTPYRHDKLATEAARRGVRVSTHVGDMVALGDAAARAGYFLGPSGALMHLSADGTARVWEDAWPIDSVAVRPDAGAAASPLPSPTTPRPPAAPARPPSESTPDIVEPIHVEHSRKAVQGVNGEAGMAALFQQMDEATHRRSA